MKKSIKIRTLPILLSGFICLGASAETVQFPIGHQGMDKNIKTPTAGMTMAEVNNQYGNANRTFNPIGDPPISKWQFNSYTVYFERDKVLHSVIHP